MGTVMVVASGKGGTGKTSICAGVASCLAAEGQRVLCIDADVGLRNLDLSLGMADLGPVSFLDVAAGRASLDDAAACPGIPGLYLLTAPAVQTPENLRVDDLAALCGTAREQFDWCLIDAPAGVGAGLRLAADPADCAMVVSTGDPASLRDAGRTAQILGQLGLSEMKLVVNRVDRRLFSGLHATIDDVMDAVGLPLLGVVPDDRKVMLASSAGVPLVLYESSGAAAACLHIARRLRGLRIPLMKIR